MKLLQDGRIYYLISSYSEKEVPKAAGFRWNPDRRRWETWDLRVASRLAQYADEPLRSHLLQSEENSRMLEAESKAASVAEGSVSIPCPPGLSYLPYQAAGIATAVKRPSVLFADEMGLGKTIEAVGVLNSVEWKTCLLVCPASTKINWERELRKWLVKPREIYVVRSREEIPASAELVIVNYDRLEQVGTNRDWDVLIADEVHYARNTRSAKRGQLLLGVEKKINGKYALVPGIAQRARRKIFLTGTPIVNRPVELWGILRTLDPENWTNFWAFAKRYCDARQNRYGWDLSGASHLDELQEKLRRTVMIRRKKSDVLTELPPKRRSVLYVDTNGDSSILEAEAVAWDQFVSSVMRSCANKIVDDVSDVDGVSESINFMEPPKTAFDELARVRHKTALAKVPYVLGVLDDALESTDKIAVWGHHHDVLRMIVDHFGGSAVLLTGEESEKQKQEAVDRFQNDPSVRVFVGSILAGGVGITLTATSNVYFVELDWVPGNISQAEDRHHRIGQKNSVNITHIVFAGSIDARLAEVLIQKQEVLDKALDREYESDSEKINQSVLSVASIVEKEAEELIHVSKSKEIRPYTEDQKTALLDALRTLESADSDRARLRNGSGYNRFDSYIGCRLARMDYLSDRAANLAYNMLRKYKKQLDPKLYYRIYGD